MRISDGSSDVCSSDLDIAERRTRIRGTILCNSLLLFGNLQRLDREIGFLAAVETDNHRIDLLAGLEAVGTLFVTVAAKIATLDEASCTVFTGLDFKAAIADFKNRDGNGRALVKAAGRGRNACTRRTLFKLLHAQRNRSEAHTSELQSLMRRSYAVFC